MLFAVATVAVWGLVSGDAGCRHYEQFPLDYCMTFRPLMNETNAGSSMKYSCVDGYPMKQFFKGLDCSTLRSERDLGDKEPLYGLRWSCDEALPVCDFALSTMTYMNGAGNCTGDDFYEVVTAEIVGECHVRQNQNDSMSAPIYVECAEDSRDFCVWDLEYEDFDGVEDQALCHNLTSRHIVWEFEHVSGQCVWGGRLDVDCSHTTEEPFPFSTSTSTTEEPTEAEDSAVFVRTLTAFAIALLSFLI